MIETMNKFMVGARGDEIRVGRFQATCVMTKADALNLAAWLVAVADEHDEFPQLSEAVRNT